MFLNVMGLLVDHLVKANQAEKTDLIIYKYQK